MQINEKRVAQHFRSFEKALVGFNDTEPLSRYLTRFFKENKQMGSSDRKMTSRFIYNYFRLGNCLKDESVLNRLCFTEYLCETESPIVFLHHPVLSETQQESLDVKIDKLVSYASLSVEELFPLIDHLSPSIDKEVFLKSHFIQPDLFIRIKQGSENEVLLAFDDKGIEYREINKNTLALSNGVRLQDFQSLEGKYEVQDLSSQKTIDYMDASENESWWDACTGSGGKALMFLDKYPSTNLLVSDIRLSILRNLKERFDKAKIKSAYRQKIIDLLGDTTEILGNEQFDGIILDVPCSGSGTWGRTPEMIQQFSLGKLNEFTELQKAIATSAVKHLKVGKPLIYMTCSVYTDENEQVVQHIVDHLGCSLEKMELIKGYPNKADTMFAARLIRSN